MKVKEAMHKGAEWVTPDTPLREVARLMRHYDIGAIPVGTEDKIVGMITDRDIVCKAFAKEKFDVEKATARDVMSKGIHTCREEDELEAAAHHMQELQVRRLPVIDRNKKMVGILSLGDLSHAAPPKVSVDCLKRVAAHH